MPKLGDIRDFMHGSGEGWKSPWYQCPHCKGAFSTDYEEKNPNLHLDVSSNLAESNFVRHMNACKG